jgi:phosphotransferase system enzyme I (PtsI)
MASHPLMAVTLLGLGLRTMSVNPRAVAAIKRVFRAVSADDARTVANQAIAAPNALEAEAIVSRYLRDAIGPHASTVAGLPVL